MSNSTRFSDIFLTNISHPEEMAEKYPWCSIAQLSLLQQYKKNHSTQFEIQAIKTALLFNNSNWLNWQLHQLSKENEVEESKPEEISESLTPEQEQKEKIQQSLSDVSSQSNTTETTIAFEPLHTTDYFASQGIKLTDAPVTNDKLGSQMKSFTEWLKSMKKIHQQKLGEGDEQTDKNIQQIAESSNAEAEVITEAMADVLIKQNKTEKAIAVYEKLSLLNPSKSAFFAAKIDRIKTP